MQETRRNFWVGLFVLVGLAMLAALTILFGRLPERFMAAEAYAINIEFPSATGIRPGTLVTVHGIPVGRVQEVGFVDPRRFDLGVTVAVSLKEGYQLRDGSYARTSEPGLGMGRPPIVIVPPQTPGRPLLPSGATIDGQISPAVESLIPSRVVNTFDKTAEQIGEAAAKLTPVLADLHEVLQRRDVAAVDRPGGPPGNLSTAMARLDTGLKHFNTVFGDPDTQSQLRTAVANLHSMSLDGKTAAAELRVAATDVREAAADAKTLVVKGRESLDRLDGHVDRVARSAIADLESLGRFLERMNVVGKRIADGEGTLGRLVSDDRLYEALVLSFRRLAETVEEFRLLVKDWQKGKIRVGI